MRFSGSINDSKHGFQNYESVKVFKTWAGTQEYVDADASRFEKIWNRKDRNLKICGEKRNSYSKTDPDATFMHMKDDHMNNSQLKPGYNVQFAVNSGFVTGIGVFSDRTDFGTLIPLLSYFC